MNEAVSKVLANLGLDADPFKQEKVIELVKNPLSGAWVTVYSHHDAADGRPSVFACFADLTKKEEILAGDDWLKNRNRSSDSRDERLGAVDERLIIGKAVLLVFPGRDSLTDKRDFSRLGSLKMK